MFSNRFKLVGHRSFIRPIELVAHQFRIVIFSVVMLDFMTSPKIYINCTDCVRLIPCNAKWNVCLCTKIGMRSRLTVSKSADMISCNICTNILNNCTVFDVVHRWFSYFVHHINTIHLLSSTKSFISKWNKKKYIHTQKPHIIQKYWDTDQANPKCAWKPNIKHEIVQQKSCN